MKNLKTLAILAALLPGGFALISAQAPVPSAAPPLPVPEVSPAPPQPVSSPSPSPTSQPSPFLMIAPSMPGGAPPPPGPTPGPPLAEPQPLPSLPLMPEALPSPAPAVPPPPPAPSLTGKTIKLKPGASPTPLPLTAEQLRKNIRLRQLATQVLHDDPAVTDMRHTADLAKTFEGRRTALRDYYTLLYTRIEKLDPSLHDLVERILFNRLFALEQHRVRPSKLIEPIPVLPGSHSDDHLSGRIAGTVLLAPATPTPAPAAVPGENRSLLEMQ